MARGIDGNVGWSNDLQLVGVQRAGRSRADVYFFIRNIERALAVERCSRQRIYAREVSVRAPWHKLSASSAHRPTDDDSTFFVCDIRPPLSRQRDRLLSRR